MSLLSSSNHLRTFPRSFLRAIPCITMPCLGVAASRMDGQAGDLAFWGRGGAVLVSGVGLGWGVGVEADADAVGVYDDGAPLKAIFLASVSSSLFFKAYGCVDAAFLGGFYRFHLPIFVIARTICIWTEITSPKFFSVSLFGGISL
ncbi:hypothetical protein BDZ91DRAFT_718988 [Kalaharituber pfeilii]|nr:hypothetical protein BDZ91DRAFT_718988 [Kalaharituber pfeilii]